VNRRSHQSGAEAAGMDETAVEHKGRVQITCSFCGGGGKDPFGVMSQLSTCCVCGGSGLVRVAEPYTRCRHCRGTGAVKTLTCTVCGGKGFVPETPGPTMECPECAGSGDDGSAPAMACMRCRGRGRLPYADK
jgi:DnaJ-class molecular chaperone